MTNVARGRGMGRSAGPREGRAQSRTGSRPPVDQLQGTRLGEADHDEHEHDGPEEAHRTNPIRGLWTRPVGNRKPIASCRTVTSCRRTVTQPRRSGRCGHHPRCALSLEREGEGDRALRDSGQPAPTMTISQPIVSSGRRADEQRPDRSPGQARDHVAEHGDLVEAECSEDRRRGGDPDRSTVPSAPRIAIPRPAIAKGRARLRRLRVSSPIGPSGRSQNAEVVSARRPPRRRRLPTTSPDHGDEPGGARLSVPSPRLSHRPRLAGFRAARIVVSRSLVTVAMSTSPRSRSGERSVSFGRHRTGPGRSACRPRSGCDARSGWKRAATASVVECDGHRVTAGQPGERTAEGDHSPPAAYTPTRTAVMSRYATVRLTIRSIS